MEDVFGLVYQVTEESFGEMNVVELKAGGAEIPVTSENK